MGLPALSQKLAEITLNYREPVQQMEGPQLATVVSSTPTTVEFTLNGDSTQSLFGPAPYQPFPGASPAAPPRGTQCLVVFLGSDVSQPYVLMFMGWP